MINDAGNGLAHSPTLSEFVGYIESNLEVPIRFCLVLLEFYFNWPLESLKSDKK